MRGFEFLFPLEMAKLFRWGPKVQGAVQSSVACLGFFSSNVVMNHVSGDSPYDLVAKFAAFGALGTAAMAATTAMPTRGAAEALFLGGAVVYATEVPASPALRSAIVDARHGGLGEALGAAALVEGLTQLAAVSLYGGVFDAVPGSAAYAFASACLLLATPAALATKRLHAMQATQADYQAIGAGDASLQRRVGDDDDPGRP